MPTEEEQFSELLHRLGFKSNRSSTQQLFRNDAAADILSWMMSTITDRNLVHPDVIQEYETVQTTNCSLLDSPRSSLRSVSKWEDLGLDTETELLRKQEELQSLLQQRDERKSHLTLLKDDLERQLNHLDEKMKLSYQEEDQNVNDLVIQSQNDITQMADDVDSSYSRFSNLLTEFTHLMNTQGPNVYFTQDQSDQYWKQSQDITQGLERLTSGVVCQELLDLKGKGNVSKIDDLINRSELESCSWFQELERLRQYTHVSELARVDKMLKDKRLESIQTFLNESAMTQNYMNGSGEAEIEDLKEEVESLKTRKQFLLKTELPSAISDFLQCYGTEILQNYIPRISVEWNGILLQKQQLLELAACHLDRARLFKILADVELQQMEEMIHYLMKLGQNSKQLSEKATKRKIQYTMNSKTPAEFVQTNDHLLQSMTTFLKFCVRRIEMSEVLSSMEVSTGKQGVLKRLYSSAFSPRTSLTNDGSPGFSPVSKMIKEQQTGIFETPIQAPQSERSIPLEESLRRLSMTPASPVTTDSLFQDSPAQQHVPETSLHELSLIGNRILSLLKTSNQRLLEILPESLFQKLIESTDGLCEVFNRVFLPNEDGLVLSAPNLDKAFEGCDQLIEELNKTSGDLKGQFRSLLAYFERQVQEVESRDALIKFYIK